MPAVEEMRSRPIVTGTGNIISRVSARVFGGVMAASFAMLAAGQAQAESVLTMHIEEQTSWVQNFNPFDLGGRRQSTMDFVYEPLVIFNDYDSGKPVWRLATGYKFADDLKSITYTLRDGVKWSDGKPLTSADMKFTLELMLKNPAVDTAAREKTPAADLFHGTVSMFEQAGFSEVARPKPDRAIMQRRLRD